MNFVIEVIFVCLLLFVRLQHCMAKGWLRFGLNGDILEDNHLNVHMTNVAGNSPVFNLNGKKEIQFFIAFSSTLLKIKSFQVYSLPHDKILNLPKSKAFAYDKINVT